MTERTPARPPLLAQWSLRALVPRRIYDEVSGDLFELFLTRKDRDGGRSARRWYWRQVLHAFFALEPVRRPVISRRISGDPAMLTIAQDAHL